MKENATAIEQRIKRAIEETTPDVLPEVLRRIEAERGGNVEMNDTTIPANDPITWQKAEKKKRKRATWTKWAAGVAAAFALVFLVQFGYGQYTPQAMISFDVNPSIEIKVNKAEKVLSIQPLNEEAQIVIGDMELKNVDLNIAVNALIGSMVKHGYISEIKNSILISVDSSNAEKGVQLKERLTQEVNSLLDSYALNGAVLSQTVSEDGRIKALAQEHQISYGKAVLVDLLVSQNATLQFSDVAKLPINDINLLMDAKKSDLSGVVASGQASSQGYIGEAKAKEIAFAHAGTTEAAIRNLDIELDYDDGQMVYDVEFWVDNREYDYEIDAVSGAIFKYDVETKSQFSDLTTKINGAVQISADQAQTIAFGHAGVSGTTVTVVKNKQHDQHGRSVYDIEFLYSEDKYSYEIDTVSGEIIKHKKKNHQSTDSTQYISMEKAREIALSHAGATLEAVRKLEIKRDKEDGRMVYEIEFIYGSMEYEYEIDAVTGAILFWESEED